MKAQVGMVCVYICMCICVYVYILHIHIYISAMRYNLCSRKGPVFKWVAEVMLLFRSLS